MATFTQGTNVDKIEILSSGIVRVRLRKEVLKDGSVLSYEYHSTTLCPGDDTSAALTALNTNLSANDAAEITATAWTVVVAQCIAAWTDAVVAAYKATLTASASSSTDTSSTSSTSTTSA